MPAADNPPAKKPVPRWLLASGREGDGNFGGLGEGDATRLVGENKYSQLQTRRPFKNNVNTVESTLFAGREGPRERQVTKSGSGAFWRTICFFSTDAQFSDERGRALRAALQAIWSMQSNVGSVVEPRSTMSALRMNGRRRRGSGRLTSGGGCSGGGREDDA